MGRDLCGEYAESVFIENRALSRTVKTTEFNGQWDPSRSEGSVSESLRDCSPSVSVIKQQRGWYDISM